MSLAEVSNGRNNNLNIIRFIAALLVILGHCYLLSGEVQSVGPLYKLTGQPYSGSLAVCAFFFFSGFLINKSVQKGCGLLSFCRDRCIRIIPSLAIVVILCAFVLGPCITTYSLAEYLTNAQTYQYLLNITVVAPKYNLPGVFETNICGSSVNGSLWTLRVEFLCYIICYILWKAGLSEQKRAKYLIPPFLVAYFTSCYGVFAAAPSVRAALRACGMFYCGMIYYTYRESIRIDRMPALLCAAGMVISIAVHLYDIGLLLCLPYVLVYLAFGTKIKWSSFGAKAEISYGIYLCAYPIQQTVTMLFGASMPPWLNFLITLPIAVLCGLLLNIFVETPITRKFKKEPANPPGALV
ncbi:MAG: acyltransferase [Clostridiales bacterium]|nr:acyltransferase [Clostridiales bacterium]